jgi:hypothetical protein
MYIVPEKDYKRFIKALDSMSERYDPDWKGPAMQLGSANYHTTLSYTTVHSTRDAFQYGAALLASGRDADLERAIEVLDNVVRLQDQDPTNATYGIWSWYMDEPLEKMSPARLELGHLLRQGDNTGAATSLRAPARGTC